MRIAMVTETFLPSVDGVVTRLAHALDWLAAQGHELCVVAPDLGVRDYKGIPVHGVRAVTMPFYRSRPWGLPSRRVGRCLQEFAPDVVHVWQPDLVGLSAVHACRRLGLPLATSYHTNTVAYLDYYRAFKPLKGLLAAYERELLNAGDLTLVTSGAMRRELVARGVQEPLVLPRGVDLAARDPRFASSEMRARLTGGEPWRPLLVYVGRVAAEKGLDTLLPVMRAHPDWALAVVGGGPELERLRELFAGTRTHFAGFLGGGELSAAFASGDAFVFPSTTETLGLVILEAQASGVPVVAAASPATCEQVRDGVDGVVYDPQRPETLAEALERVLSDKPRAAAIAQAALAVARQNSWDQASAALTDAYEQAIALRGAAR